MAASSIVVRILAPRAPSPPVPVPPPVPLVAPRVEPAPETRAATDGGAEVRSTGPKSRTAATSPASAAAPLPATAPALPPASDYLLASRLDPGPKLLEDVDLVYPPEAGLMEGSVVLRLLIGSTGTVDEVIVVRSLPKGVFDRSAVAAFSAARFSPGLMLGVPVKSQVTIEVHFTPIDRGGNVSAPTY